MDVTNHELLELVRELQSLDSLQPFALAGGTNLSIRYDHRESIDIDLFSNQMVGSQGLSAIEKQLRETFKAKLLYLNIEDPGHGEQYRFIKSLIRNGGSAIKVEILQNIQLLNPIEIINDLRLISVEDIGTMKLQSLTSRKAQKDVYDLDRITDEIPLAKLIEQLKTKEEKFADKRYKSLFDLDENTSPALNPTKLLTFDNINFRSLEQRPSHSNDILKIVVGNKNWSLARAHLKRKVIQYCKENNLAIPKLGPIRRSRGIR